MRWRGSGERRPDDSRGRKDGTQGEGYQSVKSLSTGHPLTRVQAQRTPQEPCFLGKEGAVIPKWTQNKAC